MGGEMRARIVSATDFLPSKRWDPRSHLGDPREREETGVAPIGKFASERREQSKPPSGVSETFIYIGLENVESITGDLVGTVHRKGGDVRSASKHFRRGDVLFSRLRPNLNKVCCPPFDAGYCSGEFVVLVPKKGMTARVLRELIASPRVAQRLIGLVAGATLPRVGTGDLLALPVPEIDPVRVSELTSLLLEADAERKKWKDLLTAQVAEVNTLVGKFHICKD